jgi:hypothetical protein
MQEILDLAQGFSVALTLPNIGFMLIGIVLLATWYVLRAGH